MSLSAKDKSVVKAFWAKVCPKAVEIGSEALGRMLYVYPQTKTYFSHWADTSPGSAPVKKHGAVIMGAVNDSVEKLDDLMGNFGDLSDLHAFKLRVDPANFKFFAHCLIVVMAMYHPAEFTPEVHVAVDKFFQNLSAALSERYR
ncbi:hemoglobin subunit alpha-like [Lampris incognitus]|uniref:hemoglobin subunit alpha-like n=1 Tax=Lampris incognitus TaxID=2546036 RepID=UPI0024B59D17|nr:hemoglobin subunit alpha-like [Lampris incognitus]